jgi:AcrR family transcriptional regulator
MTVSDTPERILDAAERLFARQGVAATSLRSITTDAGVNPAASHYHFGSKRELVAAILTRRITPLSEARIRRLEQLEKLHPAGPIPIGPLVEAFVVPVALVGGELREEVSRLGSLFAWLRVEAETGGDWQALMTPRVDVRGRFAHALCRGRDLGPSEAADRFHYAMGAIVQLLRQETLREPPCPAAADLEILRTRLDRLIGFLAAGLGAPPASIVPASKAPCSAAQERVA